MPRSIRHKIGASLQLPVRRCLTQPSCCLTACSHDATIQRGGQHLATDKFIFPCDRKENGIQEPHALWSVPRHEPALTSVRSNRTRRATDWVFVCHAQPTHQNCNEEVTEMTQLKRNRKQREPQTHFQQNRTKCPLRLTQFGSQRTGLPTLLSR